MRPETLERLAAPVPRYTSYPTAPHFSSGIGADDYGRWLEALPQSARLSVYAHIPYCDTLCWYCGCNTKATQRYEPVARNLALLLAEIELVATRLGAARHAVTHVHLGGGSPSILTPDDIARLDETLRRRFRIAEGAEIAVEIDPRGLDAARIDAFARAGVSRVSLGVQDFDPAVQAAINRLQSLETTARALDMFRERGVRGLNIDLVYGLPHQTQATLAATIAKVVSLRPDRIALFGYAHLPSRLPHQRLIPDAALPGTAERLAQAVVAADALLDAGYVRVGLDHFALPHDPMASGPLARNFQGYTTDTAEALIGLGASAIGRLPRGYVQNAAAIGEYERRIGEGRLATVRGHALTPEDEIRAMAIERLMCDLAFPAEALRARYGSAASAVLREADALARADADGLVEPLGRGCGFRVTEKGRPFVRTLAAAFDTYLGSSAARHSAGV